MLKDKNFVPSHAMRILSDRSDRSDLSDNTQKKRSVRQFDPAFIAAIAGNIGRLVDEFRHIFKNTAISLLVFVIDERLPSDDLDPPLSPEILTRDAAFLLKIDEFEHDSSLNFLQHFLHKSF